MGQQDISRADYKSTRATGWLSNGVPVEASAYRNEWLSACKAMIWRYRTDFN